MKQKEERQKKAADFINQLTDLQMESGFKLIVSDTKKEIELLDEVTNHYNLQGEMTEYNSRGSSWGERVKPHVSSNVKYVDHGVDWDAHVGTPIPKESKGKVMRTSFGNGGLDIGQPPKAYTKEEVDELLEKMNTTAYVMDSETEDAEAYAKIKQEYDALSKANQETTAQLNEYESRLKKARELKAEEVVTELPVSLSGPSYFTGVYNGMELILSVLEGRKASYKYDLKGVGESEEPTSESL